MRYDFGENQYAENIFNKNIKRTSGVRDSVTKSISVIGGADGPTSIFVAGKLHPFSQWPLVAVGIILLALWGYMKIKHEK